MKYSFLFLMTLFGLVGCAQKPMNYAEKDFINPNKVVIQKEKMPKVKVAATYGYGNDPAVEKAYHDFLKTGQAKNVDAPGFRTIAYSAQSHPLVVCEPLRLCVVQLEEGENINDINLGDSVHWSVRTSLMGTPAQGSYQLSIKPAYYNISTDMVITTNKRTYTMGLVSQHDHATHVINFYYPEETLSHSLGQTQAFGKENGSEKIATGSLLSVDHLNFNYQLQGDHPAWSPTRIFDDGDKTFIQMPPPVERMDLPVLYLRRGGEMQLTNYRYQQPYYIVDGLFQTAYLISGKGRQQIKVIIQNRQAI